MLTDDDREAILKAMAEEQKLKLEGKPYREAVLLACEVTLRVSRRSPSPDELAAAVLNFGATVNYVKPPDPLIPETIKAYAEQNERVANLARPRERRKDYELRRQFEPTAQNIKKQQTHSPYGKTQELNTAQPAYWWMKY